jgi:hypothetical protein
MAAAVPPGAPSSQQLGCDIAQGYYLSRPLPPDQLGVWLLRHTAAHGAVRVSS